MCDYINSIKRRRNRETIRKHKSIFNELKNKANALIFESLSPDDKYDFIYKNIFVNKKIDDMHTKCYTPYVYNDSYGGYEMSTYCKVLEKFMNLGVSSNIDRHLNLAKIISFLGDMNKTEVSKLTFKFCNYKYFDFIIISEYDGLETISIDYKEYKLKLIDDITNSNKSSDDKIIEIKNIISMNDDKNVLI